MKLFYMKSKFSNVWKTTLQNVFLSNTWKISIFGIGYLKKSKNKFKNIFEFKRIELQKNVTYKKLLKIKKKQD